MADISDLQAEASYLAARISASSVRRTASFLRSGLPSQRKRVVIVGAGMDAEKVARWLRQAPDRYEILGNFDDRTRELEEAKPSVQYLGNLDDLLVFCRRTLPDIIILSIFSLSRERFLDIFQKIRVLPVDIEIALRKSGSDPKKASSEAEFSMILIEKQPLSGFDYIVKFLEDKIISILLLLFLSPVFALIAILIKYDSKGPIFFEQMRYGFNSNPIPVLKFRTMYTDLSDPTGVQKTVRDDPRVTRVGRYLRRYSLDELPQLWNVLAGQMSIVGPRAHVASMRVGEGIYEDVVKNYLIRHKLNPGITGLAQVRGCRGEVKTLRDARRRLSYDIFYINHWSLFLDMKIIMETIYIVLFKNDDTY
ncbi:exopolysaccharide biosynthesis polyprenyl glycosylphosphotransferase [Gluconacetobacter liquefaciens]|uniref:Exopolysaccharide biosynthesis polyprenyl glycosylphosphotransferase n=1 Tax=Gluconacetobacter liquefaciens TaxID=89584 RepID=A0A7W4PCR6_GLULI|nr:exopolysaccharide biosynthesis polyprenyl glycosylphosphotransferase [Gluconacetobacter liquefaciens]MBB2187604.1 exopolysaccharide biosynthesis polyprenyl glycosylphosphotransferase [Gluconacetobacter liquefaciens]